MNDVAISMNKKKNKKRMKEMILGFKQQRELFLK